MPAMHPVTVLSGSRLGESAQRKPYAKGAWHAKTEAGASGGRRRHAQGDTRGGGRGLAGDAGRRGMLPDDQARIPPARVVGEVAGRRAQRVECSGSYGSGLTRHLAKNGFAVLEVTFPDKTVRRKRGKDDFIDAGMAAEAAFTGARTVTPKSRDGMVEALRMLQKTRSTAVAARKVALQMIRADVISAPEELRDQLRGMTRMQLIRRLVATRPDATDFRTPLGAAKMALKRLAKRYVDLDDEVSELDDMIDAILVDAAPLLVQLKCVGAQSAAQLMATVGDNPERLRSEASFAMLCGVAPVPVSSGMTYRHRLNRGGDRQANSAIHIIAIGRLRTDERTKEYVAKKMSEGHTKMEAIRCLKRYIAREVYYTIKKQSKLVNCS